MIETGLSDKLPRVEEESPTLRREDGSGRYGEPRSSGSLTSSFYRQQSLEDTNKAYEDRIKSLEKALQGAYSRSASGSCMCFIISSEQQFLTIV